MRKTKTPPPPPTTRLLRFADIIVDPVRCPRRIHARSHWIDGETCKCQQ